MKKILNMILYPIRYLNRPDVDAFGVILCSLYSIALIACVLSFYFASPNINKVTRHGETYLYTDTLRMCRTHPDSRYTVKGIADYKPEANDICCYCKRIWREHKRIWAEEEKRHIDAAYGLNSIGNE